MKHLKIFENNLELKNEIDNHLSQFPYLSYSIKDNIITFNKDVTYSFANGLLDPFTREVIKKEPVTIKITGKKNVEKFDEYNGKVVIENIEKVDFPDLNINNIEVKIDSGATTSSIHATNVFIDKINKKVKFKSFDNNYTLPLHSVIRVQSSNGHEQTRPLIKMKIKIRDKVISAYFSLADRKDLEYQVLIGKDVLSGKFLINPGI